MPEATMQAQIVHELTARFWLIDHSRPGLDLSPDAVVKLVRQAFSGAHGDPYQWLRIMLTSRYRTALQGHAGKPDLLMVRPGLGTEVSGITLPSHVVPRLVFAELKSLEGKVTPDQRTWLEALAAAGAEVWIVNPNNLGTFYEATVPLDSPPLPGLHGGS